MKTAIKLILNSIKKKILSNLHVTLNLKLYEDEQWMFSQGEKGELDKSILNFPQFIEIITNTGYVEILPRSKPKYCSHISNLEKNDLE